MRYMFDTNVFNEILDGCIEIKKIHSLGHLFVTSIQELEILKTKREVRKQALQEIFKSIDSDHITPVTKVWGVFPWGKGPWGGEEGELYPLLMERMKIAAPKGRGNQNDAIIAETSITHNCILITNDNALKSVINSMFIGKAIGLNDLLRLN